LRVLVNVETVALEMHWEDGRIVNR
jgi:hypothetical protein